jgi:hypothetical protein
MAEQVWSGGIDELARTVPDEDRRAAGRGVPSSYDVLFTWDYAKGERPALSNLREGQDVAVERPDRYRLEHRRADRPRP